MHLSIDSTSPATSREVFGPTAWVRLARVLECIQVDAACRAEQAAIELGSLSFEAERAGFAELAGTAREAAALARRWRFGSQPMDARVKIVALMRTMRHELASAHASTRN